MHMIQSSALRHRSYSSPLANSYYLFISITIMSTNPKSSAYASCCKVIKASQTLSKKPFTIQVETRDWRVGSVKKIAPERM